MRVAILGTGKMGGAMARRLSSQGHDLTLWNRTRQRAEEIGVGRVAATPAEAARDADVVISSLTDAAAVRAAYLGADGAAGSAKGQVFVEMSTAGPDLSMEVAAAIEGAGAHFVEAPVLGTVPVVESGTLVILAAGPDPAIDRAEPVLRGLGEIRRVGAYGSGASLKLVANSMLAGVAALAAELQAAGVAAGLNPEDVFWVVARLSPTLNARKAAFIEHEYTPANFAVHDALKDLRLALELYRKTGATTPLTEATRALYEQAAKAAGYLDMGAIASLYEHHPAASN